MLKVNQIPHPSLLDPILFLQGAVGLVFQGQSDPGGRGMRGKNTGKEKNQGHRGQKLSLSFMG